MDSVKIEILVVVIVIFILTFVSAYIKLQVENKELKTKLERSELEVTMYSLNSRFEKEESLDKKKEIFSALLTILERIKQIENQH